MQIHQFKLWLFCVILPLKKLGASRKSVKTSMSNAKEYLFKLSNQYIKRL